MEKGNVLVVGYAGVGKTTLIKAVLGEKAEKKVAGTGKTSKTCKDFQIYENPGISFRLIDTVGIEPGVFKEHKAVNAVKKWCGESIKNTDDDIDRISAIWFCVDKYTAQLFPKTIDSLMKAISVWHNAPIVVVITQSYKESDTKPAQEIIEKAFLSKKKYATRLSEIMTVVAKPSTSEDGKITPPKGIVELIELTNSLLPEGYQAAEKDVAKYNLSRRRAMSHAVAAAATLAGVTLGVGAPPFADAMLLKPTETVAVESISKIWGIKKNKQSKEFMKKIIELGTKGEVGKMITSGLKMIPGLNVGAAIINGFVAGCVVFAVAEGATYIFEQVYSGKKTMEEPDWIEKIMEDKTAKKVVDQMTDVVTNIPKNADQKDILDVILKAFTKKAMSL
nr:GTPase domain-containing protein [uncultured Butyrivibrio sp.]